MKHEDITIENNKTITESYNIPCEECSSKTVHKVLSSTDISGEWKMEGISYWENYQIIQCQGCHEISFRKNHRNTENIHYYQDETGVEHQDLEDTIDLYPSRLTGRKKIKSCWILPTSISTIYDETYNAYCNNLRILTSIGMRGLLEAVCIDKNTIGNNLLEKINNLVTSGVLTQANADILHKLRLLGNQAVHEVQPPSDDKLVIAMDVIENLLQSVYIMPAISEKLDR